MARAQLTRTPKPEPTWELVLKRNPVERLKQEKAPLGIRDELPALIAAGYESVPEEDIVRLQWWGLYHDKPKIGHVHAADQAPERAPDSRRSCARSARSRTGSAAATASSPTRQNIQLHWLELAALPDVFAHLDAAGLTTAGGCGDTVRNITGCPVQGLAADELFDARPSSTRRRRSSTATPTSATCRASTSTRSPPAPTAATRPRSTASRSSARSTTGARASACSSAAASRRCRGSRATSASSCRRRRRSRSCARDHDAWSEDLRYRVSRVKARLKFMVDDIGPEGMRERVEARLGRTLEDFTAAADRGEPVDHLGVHAQKQPGPRPTSACRSTSGSSRATR